MICIGHRGAMGHIAENTLESFELAINQGANSIELDIVEIEGESIVFHDSDLTRLCGVNASIHDLKLSDIQKLRVNKTFKIPLLSDVFKLVNNRVGINIELKSKNSALAVSKTIKENNYKIEDLLVSSFDHHQLLDIKQRIPEIKIGALQVSIPKDYAKFAKELGAYSVHPALEFVNKEFIQDAHNRGLKVFVFTVNSINDFKQMEKIGADGIFTNYPDIFYKYFQKKNIKF